MAVTSSSGSQLEKSYRSWLRGSDYRDSEIYVVLHGTVTILRRHSIHGTLCPACGNDDDDQALVSSIDKLGFITEVQCLACGQHLSTACRRSKYYYERITDPAVLERGDHIGWYRPFAYWHHAIVTRQGADRLAAVGYSIRNNDRPCARITEIEFEHRSMNGLIQGSVYRLTRDDAYTNEYTALRAERIIGEEKYDFFEQNCEHSVVWCETGLHNSDDLQTGFISVGKIALGIFLSASVLAVLWLLQLCPLAEDGAGGLWTERGINIAYVTLIVAVFSTYSIYKHVAQIKSTAEPPHREPERDWMESCRKDCTNGFFRCCCRKEPGCRRLTCCVCFASCFCCSLCQASCSLCAEKLRMCSVPCCGRQPSAVVALVVRVLIREVIAASGPFLVVWFVDDVVEYFEGQDVTVSGDSFANRAVIVIVAIMVVSIVAYPIGVLVSRWAQGLIDCCCCPYQAEYKPYKQYDECVKPPCPVHDEIMHIHADPPTDCRTTTVNVIYSDNQGSAVILL